MMGPGHSGPRPGGWQPQGPPPPPQGPQNNGPPPAPQIEIKVDGEQILLAVLNTVLLLLQTVLVIIPHLVTPNTDKGQW